MRENDGMTVWGGEVTTKLVVGQDLGYQSESASLTDVNLTLEYGEIFGVFGPAGSGKHPLLHMLAGLTQPSSGQLRIEDGRADGHPHSPKSDGYRRRVGFVPERRDLASNWTPLQALLHEAARFDLPAHLAIERASRLLERCYLSNHTERPVRRLTSSMRRRLDVALGLVHRPDLLIIEEPLYGVESILDEPFWRMLRSFAARGLTVVGATNDFSVVDRFDRVLLLDHGRMRALGSPDTIRRETFGGDLICVRIAGLDRSLMNRILSLPYVRGAIRLDAASVQLLLIEYRRDRKRLESVLRRAGYPSASIRKCELPFDRIFRALTI